MANNIIIWSNSGRLWNIRGWLGHVTVRMCRWVVREKDKGVGKSKFAGIAINCYLQGCSFSEPRWIFAFQRTCNPCCRILDLSAAVKRIWMGRIFQFYGLSWRSTSAHHITDTLSFKMSGTNTGYVKPPPKVIHHFSFLIITFQHCICICIWRNFVFPPTAISKPTNPVQLPGLSASARKQWKSGFKEGNKQRKSGFKEEIMESWF